MVDWVSVGTILALATPLAGVPLTAITFYLRALREQYANKAVELASRLDRVDALVDTLGQRLADVERGSTTREEWIRENMLARRERGTLSAMAVRLQARLQVVSGCAAATPLEQASRAVTAAAQRLERACAAPAVTPTRAAKRPEEQC